MDRWLKIKVNDKSKDFEDQGKVVQTRKEVKIRTMTCIICINKR